MKKIWVISENYYNEKDGNGRTMNILGAYDSETKARSVFSTLLDKTLKEDMENTGFSVLNLGVEESENSISIYKLFNHDSFHHDFKLEEIEVK